MARVTPDQIRQMKARGERIPMLTAYDYPTAQILDAAGLPMLLVGDSLGMVILGHPTTLPVTVDAIIHHTQAVVRGTEHALVIADLPFGAFQVSTEETMRSAVRIMKEAQPQAVKLEGGRRVAASVQALTEAAARALLDDVAALEEAGAFAVVLELVPAELARLVTERSGIPTIGIGAGPYCDGEVQVVHDILGLFPDFTPRHTRRFAELGVAMREAAQAYVAEVRERTFPTEAQSAKMDATVIAALREEQPQSSIQASGSPESQAEGQVDGQADGYAPPKVPKSR
jgi:3-methyl-2-oxobutanoate hydroxymethyltransferase